MNRERRPLSRRRLLGRVFAWAMAAVAVAAVFAVAWIGVRGALAYSHLRDAQAAAQDALRAPADTESVTAALAGVVDDTAAARSLTSDPIWRAVEHLAWVGPQLAAVSTVAAALDDVAGSAQPLLDLASTFSPDSLRPVDGAIDISRFAGVEAASRAAANEIRGAAASVDGIDQSALAAPLRAPVAEVRDLLTTASQGTSALARTAALLPVMLGSTEPRQYLVVFQNNAEWRSLGGIAGAMAVIRTENGRLSLVAQGSSADFPPFPEPVAPLSAEELSLFGRQPARFIQNVTQIPDFTRGAPIAREMWRLKTGTEVDGVIAVDPVALSYVLRATGPLTLPSGDVIDADNAVDLLLNGVYLRYPDPAQQDLFFAQASAGVFSAIAGGAADPTALLKALSQAGDEHRLLVWNARPEEQSVLDGTTLQGRFADAPAEEATFGVFANDTTASKMSYYLDLSTATGTCVEADGSSTAGLTVTLRNDAPADAASLPVYITGTGENAPRGSAASLIYVYLPTGSELVFSEQTEGDVPSGFTGGQDAGRQVVAWSTTLAPGQSATMQVRVRTSAGTGIGTVVTPIVNTNVTPALAFACDVTQ